MDICFITDNPGTNEHPVIGPVLQTLSARHSVRLLDVRALTAGDAIAAENGHPRADIYLLKSHAFQALEVAHELEQKGALVINNWASSMACQDRLLMAQRMQEAGLPGPRTWSFRTGDIVPSKRVFPLMIKSRYSSRGDLVAKVDGPKQLQTLAQQSKLGPFILQDYVQGDRWDIKLWVIDGQVFAARRRTSLETNTPEPDSPPPLAGLPRQWTSIALKAGRAFGLHLYGVDLMMTNQGPVLVDVNSFPGFRGVAGADRALVSVIERLGAARH